MNNKNIFDLHEISPSMETFHSIFSNDILLIEKIVSCGQVTSENKWMEQEKNEWVALLQGEAEILFEKDNQIKIMRSGDHILIPSKCRHRVTYTSTKPPCIWLAVHFK